MRFTRQQYEEAINNLRLGMQQLEPDPKGCMICGGDCWAGVCRFNPLRAMWLCQQISEVADKFHEALHKYEELYSHELSENAQAFHEALHWFAGYTMHMGEQQGPRSIVLPPES